MKGVVEQLTLHITFIITEHRLPLTPYYQITLILRRIAPMANGEATVSIPPFRGSNPSLTNHILSRHLVLFSHTKRNASHK